MDTSAQKPEFKNFGKLPKFSSIFSANYSSSKKGLKSPLAYYFLFYSNIFHNRPTLAMRVGVFFKHFQLLIINLLLVAFKGIFIHTLLKETCKLITASASLYNKIPTAILLFLSQGVLSFFQKWQQNRMFHNSTKVTFAHIVGCENHQLSSEDQDNKCLKAELHSTFFKLIMAICSIVITATTFYQLLTPILSLLIVLTAATTSIISLYLAKSIESHKNKIKKLTQDLNEKEHHSSQQAKYIHFQITNSEYAMQACKQVNALIITLSSDMFRVITLAVSAILVFTGQYHGLLLTLQIQSAQDAYKSICKYILTPALWGKFKGRLSKLNDFQRKQDLETPEGMCLNRPPTALVKYALIGLCFLGAFSAKTTFTLLIQLIQSSIALTPIHLGWLILPLYTLFCLTTRKVQRNEINAALVLVPALIFMGISSYLSLMSLTSLFIALPALKISGYALIILASSFAFEKTLFNPIYSLLAIILTYASQQFMQIFKVPLIATDKIFKTRLSGPPTPSYSCEHFINIQKEQTQGVSPVIN
ncbi:hypothetical protein MMH89_00730 [Candidatus Comchoanobacter bicostacola]|uniref:ABC transmembrane type-1 domain-containing protein n=1 Tax=Candidatus Comchoanobacter bicostacola TaxID=2919598 RepID=A0ABY5DJI4_9GAMM|nr:hypothetical protein [Candidatus Comchoanobacter bicostacola]UTC24688.1 hypothetical protein MMH89_00730 [Candidatus Comchoanobacter bicostacola]